MKTKTDYAIKLLKTLNEKFPTSYSVRSSVDSSAVNKDVTLEFVPNITDANGEVLYGVGGIADTINNHIRINTSEWEDYYDDDIYEWESQYEHEMRFANKNVETFTDYIKWIVCHEYYHLKEPFLQNHPLMFFVGVQHLYQNI
jgi:hypothetical protein